MLISYHQVSEKIAEVHYQDSSADYLLNDA